MNITPQKVSTLEWTSAAMQAEVQHWRTVFADTDEAFRVWGDLPQGTNPGESEFLEIEGDWADSAGALSLVKGHDVGLFYLFAAAAARAAAFFSSEASLIFDTPLFRPQPDSSYYTDRVPLVLARESAGETGKEWLIRVQKALAEAYKHQNFPFARFAEENGLPADAGASNVLMHYGALHSHLPETGTYDLLLGLEREADSLRYRMRFRSHRWSEKAAERFRSAFELCLHQLLSPAHRLDPKAVRALWQAKNAQFPTEWPRESTIFDKWEESTQANLSRIALREGDQTWTYKDLRRRAGHIAHGLQRKGLRKGHKVLVYGTGSADLVTVALAVISAGAVYLPVDASIPESRLRFIVEDAAPTVVIALHSWTIQTPEVPAVSLESLEWVDMDSGAAPELPVIEANDPAYIIYTSGSTGKPKGVEISHANLVQLFFQDDFPFDFRPEDKWVLFHSPGFDFSIWEIFGALFTGGELCICPKDIAADGERFADFLLDHKVSVLNQTPGAFFRVAEHLWKDGSHHDLRMVIFGGESLDTAALQPYAQASPKLQFVNGYGITETTIFLTFRFLSEADIAQGVNNIGSRLPTCVADICGPEGHVLPPGVPGELYVGGPGLGLGYLNRPELNADKFPETDSGRRYRSGDRLRKLPDGSFEFHGRIDRQLKVRGYRIEPGEIRAAMLALNGVNECFVGLWQPGEGEPALTAWYKGGWQPEAILESLRKTLPAYMIPQYFIPVQHFPLTANGKVAEDRLPAPQWNEEGKQEPPQGAAEERIATLMAEVLQRETVGRSQDFFLLGGNSIRATRLAYRISAEFEGKVGLADIFATPTVAQLAELAGTPQRQRVRIERAPEQPHYPLSNAQRRMWILAQMEETGFAYDMPVALTLHGPLDVDALQSALNALVQNHESLRTVFRQVEGEPRQFILPPFEPEIVEYDWRGDSDVLARISNAVKSEAEARFDLETGPLFRIALFRTADQEHVLSLNIHHIVSDMWSMEVLRRELFAAYDAFHSGRHYETPVPEIQYKDFALWQNAALQSAEMQASRAWWHALLSDEPPVLDFPSDKKRPLVKSYRGDYISFELPEPVSQQLLKLASESRAGNFTLLLAALQGFLYRYTRQADFTVGAPVMGRSRPELESQIGYYSNTLVFRTPVAPDKGFRDWLEQVKVHVHAAYAHQEYPFDALVDEWVTRRDLSRHPLFDICLMVDERNTGTGGPEGLELELYGGDFAMSKFDLQFNFLIFEGRIAGSLNYSTDLFEARSMQQAVDCLMVFLADIAAQPKKVISALQLLPAATEAALLRQNDRVAVDWPHNANLYDMCSRWVQSRPDEIALRQGETAWTYAELAAEVNRIATAIEMAGVPRGSRIVVWAQKSPLTIAAILAVLRTGNAYVPVDPGYPEARLRFILEDSDPALALLPKDHTLFGQLSCPCLDPDEAPTGASALPDREIGPNDIAYIIYTSGSTGKPKGVEVTHGNVVRLFSHDDCDFDFRETDHWLLFHSLSFDFSVWEMFGALFWGGTLHIPEAGTEVDTVQIANLIRESGITVLNQTPGAFYRLCEVLETQHWPDLSLKEVIFGGEALDSARLAKFHTQYPQVRLVNMYGITETTVHVTFKEIGDTEIAASNSPIGRPIPTLSCYVCDSHGNLMPPYAPGELWVGGLGVAKGYLNRPELTAERFPQDNRRGEGRVYRSGDLVKWDEAGELYYLGRIDKQVKIRGYRIEPGEVQAALRGLEGVEQAHVAALQDDTGEYALYAWYTGTADDKQLYQGLRGQLPAHMVPASLMRLHKLPLTAHGKIDTDALPRGGKVSASAFAETEGDTEGRLALLYARILGLEQAGRDTHFFESGGHSLRAVSLMAALHKEFGLEVKLRDIFTHPVLQDLAAFLDAQTANPYEGIPHAPVAEYYPLSAAQRRQYVINRFEGVGTGYNMPGAVRIRGEVSPEQIESVLTTLLLRHESLRTAFRLVEGDPVQQVLSPGELQARLSENPLLRRSEAADEADARRQVLKFIQPFDLRQAPLFRALYIRLQSDEAVLVFDLHHIISDGGSINLLQKEFIALLAGEELPLPRIQYKDFAVWQNEWFAAGALEKQSAYWKSEFADGVPLLDLATDYPRPAIQNFEGRIVTLEVDSELRAQLQALSEAEGATLFMTLLAAFNTMLRTYARQEDLVVGLPVAGRPHPDLEQITGMFVNMLPLRTRPGSGLSFRDYLAQVKDKCLSAFEHQDLPFEDMLELLEVRRDVSRNPLFDVVFMLNYSENPGSAGESLEISPFALQTDISKFDLTIGALDQGDSVSISFEYGYHLFRQETIQRMCGHYLNVLRAVVEDPDPALGRIELMQENEKAALIEKGRGPRIDIPLTRTIQQILADWAVSQPDHPAIRFGDLEWSYAEFNAKANRLGRRLREDLKVKREEIVAVLCERSADMILALAGIWKSGGAFLPIDPTYPEDRIRFLIEDSGARILLTHQGMVDSGRRDIAVLDLDRPESYAEDDSELPFISHTDDLAHVIYTSGSTGTPKGTLIPQRTLLCTLVETSAATPGPEDVILQMVNYTFDVFTWDLYAGLMNGATLQVFPRDMLLDMPALTRLIRKAGISMMFSSTAQLNMIVEHDPSCLSNIKALLYGGEAASIRHIHMAQGHVQPGTLINAYGPAESTVYVTYHATEAEPESATSVPIGIPLSNTSIYVLDAEGRLCPEGVPGELCIGGEGLAKGYHNRPELTAERFTKNPFEPGNRMYRTGDLVRWNAAGKLEYLGRMDFQVKIRGFRIEPGEVEFQVKAHPGVTESLVLAPTDENGLRYLVAYYTGPAALEAAELRGWLGGRLPEYMIPAYFLFLPQFPLTANGKIDRKALPMPDFGNQPSNEKKMPESPTELKVAGWWSQVLEARETGADENFFEVGGNSIRAVKLLSLADADYPGLLRINDLFDLATIARQAAEIDRRLKEQETTPDSEETETQEAPEAKRVEF